MRGVLWIAPLLAACAKDRGDVDRSASSLDAGAATDGAMPPDAGRDAGSHDSAPGDATLDSPGDASGASDSPGDAGSAADATGTADAPTCDDFLDGELVASIPDVGTLTAAKISRAVATPAGVHFAASARTCHSSQGCIDVDALYFAPGPVPRPTTVTNARMDGFAIAAGHAYFFDEAHALRAVELSGGTTTPTGIVGSAWSGSSLAIDGTSLYWTVYDGATHSLLRATVATSGTVATPEIVRTSAEYLGEPTASRGGLGWFEGRSAWLEATGSSAPERWFTDDAPGLYWRMAANESRIFVMSSDYGPDRDGGWIPGQGDAGGSQTLLPGPFLGARITARDFAGGPEQVVHTSSIELRQVAATPDAVIWAEAFELPGNGACPSVWRKPLTGGAPRRIVSGWRAWAGGLTTVGETVYWWSGSSVYRFAPSP